jgi:hypothetical protein
MKLLVDGKRKDTAQSVGPQPKRVHVAGSLEGRQDGLTCLESASFRVRRSLLVGWPVSFHQIAV